MGADKAVMGRSTVLSNQRVIWAHKSFADPCHGDITQSSRGWVSMAPKREMC